MTHRHLIVAPALIIALSGCLQPEETEPEPVGASPEALTESTVAAIAVVGQVAQTFDQLSEEEAPPQGMATPDGGDEPVETQNSQAPGCSTIQWSILTPLRITVLFDNCMTAAGEPLNGSVTGWLDYDGVDGAIGVALDDLTVGALAVDGFLILASDGPDAGTIDADVSIINPEGSIRVALDGRVSTAGDVLQLDGSGAFEQDAVRWAAAAAAVRWEDPEACHPTAGTVDIEAPGLPPIEVTFTPSAMMIGIGALPPFSEAYGACPGTEL